MTWPKRCGVRSMFNLRIVSCDRYEGHSGPHHSRSRKEGHASVDWPQSWKPYADEELDARFDPEDEL